MKTGNISDIFKKLPFSDLNHTYGPHLLVYSPAIAIPGMSFRCFKVFS